MNIFNNLYLTEIFHFAPEIIIAMTFLILLLRIAPGRRGCKLAIIGCILVLVVRLGWFARIMMLAHADIEIYRSLFYLVTNYGLQFLNLASYVLLILSFRSLTRDHGPPVSTNLQEF